ncbi:disease resistance RPP13-like protein 4 [Cryptomeria japonica]|uniref:disease resistance RPP13-like protein 4 n=1 Tax=Cryptomeria japonica TaxID=3369 RepID=UPI0027DA7517|nr:disease resistance RPP13-like protein 4 [Cryptomeria japonica]
MADFAVNLISRLVYMLVEKTFQEASLVSSFRDDFDFMFRELNSIKCLLIDAHGATHSSRKIRLWKVGRKIRVWRASRKIRLWKVGRKIRLWRVSRKIRVWRASRKIRVLKDRIRRIHESSKYLQYLRDMDVQPSSMLLTTDDPRIIAVTGLGGLGKFAAETRVRYPKIKETFDHRIWVEVSQSFSVQQLLQHIASEVKLPENKRQTNLSVNMLRDNIRSYLQGSRCLLVLDDVWDRRAKELIISQDFKVMISTRDKKVAQQMGAQRAHDMNHLSEADSRKLFFMHAFRKDEIESLSEDLKKIAEDIADKCSGLPLTLKTVARSMVNVRRNPNKWEPTLNRLKQFDTITDDVLPTLRLSFDALPDYLKPCFLFCSAYPEDTRMGCEYLVQVWIAEGFVNPDET